MNRWKINLAAVVLVLGTISGCTRTIYLSETDRKAVTLMGLPANLDSDPNVTVTPTSDGHPLPVTVDNPDRKIRYMTLSEAFTIALEQGNRGSQTVSTSVITGGLQSASIGGRASFLIADDLGSFTGGSGGSFTGDDAIRAFALDPAVVGADIEGALAKFDTRWITSMAWNKVDTATSNLLNNFSNGDTAQFSSGLYKPLPTGGFAGIVANTNYTKLAAPPSGFTVINPAYQPSANFVFEQPLLKDFGIEINQLLAAHPISYTINQLQPSGGRPNGILIQRVRTEQQRADFERSVNVMLFNVETTYWTLYANYFALYAQEQGLRQAFITWQLTNSELMAGKKAEYELAQVRAQFATFRQSRIDSLQYVIESERQLRGILGLPVEDGVRIVPADSPTLAPMLPDWSSSLDECLENRPELVMARQDVRINQMNVMLNQNGTRPDLRFFGNYNINSIGTQLDGPTPGNALQNFAADKFNNWTIGIRLDMPLGFRDAHSATRAAQLNLARSFVVLKNQELKAERFLASVYQNMIRYYRDIEAYQEQRKALADQLRGLYARIQAGKDPLITVLTAQTQFAQALANEYSAIANYNMSLAAWQYAKGTILQYDNVRISDGPLPNCALVRAREHFKQQTVGIVARERATLPTSDKPPTLPSLLEHQPATPPIPADLQNQSTTPLMSPNTLDPAAPMLPLGSQSGTGQPNPSGIPPGYSFKAVDSYPGSIPKQ